MTDEEMCEVKVERRKKYEADKKAELEIADIDRCEYTEPDDKRDAFQCENVGVRIVFKDSLTDRWTFQYRCEKHGWSPGYTKLYVPWCNCTDDEVVITTERDERLCAAKCSQCKRWIPDSRLEELQHHDSR